MGLPSAEPMLRNWLPTKKHHEAGQHHGYDRRARVGLRRLGFLVFICHEFLPLLIQLGLEHADVGKVAVPLGVVEPIAHDELIGALETDVAALDVGLVRRFLANKRRLLQRGGIARLQVLHQIREREPLSRGCPRQ